MSSSTNVGNDVLREKIAQTRILLSHFTKSLTASTSSSHTSTDTTTTSPLSTLRDAAKLLRAHATKIGLLLINDPFTPSAIQKELSASEAQCLPAMMGAVELCQTGAWTLTLAKEVRLRVDAVINAFRLLLDDIATKLEGGSVKVAAMTLDKKKEKVLASTGQVWEACDALVQLDVLGVGGIIAQKAQQYRDTLKDAMEELKEWGEDEDDQDEGFVGSGDDEDDKDSIEELFGGARLPAHRKDLKKLLEESLKKLKLVDMLFQALMKRRVKPFSSITFPSRDNFKRVDSLCVRLKKIPEAVDDLASTFYDLEAERVEANLDRVIEAARQVASDMRLSWTDTEDEFTKWSSKWDDAITKRSGAET